MADDITSNTATRFSIFVPEPKARINMGKPDGDAPFGYTGMSLQSDEHLLIDVNKVTLFQSGASALFQSAAKWLQWSNADMYLGSAANNTLAAQSKVTLVAGAGQGFVTALDHGRGHVAPRMVEYNNLQLHYRVEEVHNGLKELFYGKDWNKKQRDAQADQLDEYKTGYKGGLLEDVRELLGKLGHVDKKVKSLLQPLEWEGDHMDMTMRSSSVYPAFQPFDPYPAQAFNKNSWFSRFYARVVQVFNWLHRLVDILRKVGMLIQDNFIVKRVENLIKAWGEGQEAVNSFLNIADIAGFDRENKDFASGGAWNVKEGEVALLIARLPKDVPAEAASLDSLPGPFIITDAESPLLEVRDARGGEEGRVVDFSDLLTAQPAEITLSVSERFTKVTVAASDDGKIELDEVEVAYKQAESAWEALPDGFVWDPQYSAIRRSDNEPFTAAVEEGVTLIGDQSFGAGDALEFTIDGATYSADLGGVNGLSADARAEALAAAINAKAGGAATATEGHVKIRSAKVGPGASVSATVPEKLGESVGPSSATGGYGGEITAAQLAQKLSGQGNFAAAVTGAGVNLKHNEEGEESFIEIAGPLAEALFGADPKEAEGEASEHKVSSDDFFKDLADLRSIQWEMAKWPEDLRNQFRPVSEAFGDFVSACDRIKGLGDNLMAIVTGGFTPPKMIGLLAEDGITLGAGGPIYGAGNNVTLVATEAGEPDEKKFVGVGPIKFEKWLEVASEFDLEDAILAIRKKRASGNKVFSKLADKFKVAEKKDGHEAEGNFRIVAARHLAMIAARDITAVAIGAASIEGATAAVISCDKTTLAARSGAVNLRGKSISVGRWSDNGKQKKTESIALRATDWLDLSNKKARAVIDGAKIALGKPADAKVAPHGIDETAPRVLVDAAGGKAAIGLKKGTNEYGLWVEASGDVTVHAKAKVAIGVPNQAALTLGKQTEIAGILKVGSALLVRGDGVFTATPTQPMKAAKSRLAKIKADYKLVITKAKATRKAIDVIDKMVKLAKKKGPPPLSLATLLVGAPSPGKVRRKWLKDQEAQRKKAVIKLKTHETTWQQVLTDAVNFEVDDAELGRKDTDDAIFAVT